METISRRAVGRMGSLLFVAAGLVSIADSVMPNAPHFDPDAQAAIGAASVAIGVACWLLPWQRWPLSRTLWLAPIGLLLLSATALFGGYNIYTFGAYFMVVFVWIGLTQPRRTSLWFAPLAAVAYLVPMWFHHRTPQALSSVLELIVLCVVVAESVGWVSQHLRHAEALETRRVWDMQGLLQAGDRLARQTDAEHAAGLVSIWPRSCCAPRARSSSSPKMAVPS